MSIDMSCAIILHMLVMRALLDFCKFFRSRVFKNISFWKNLIAFDVFILLIVKLFGKGYMGKMRVGHTLEDRQFLSH